MDLRIERITYEAELRHATRLLDGKDHTFVSTGGLRATWLDCPDGPFHLFWDSDLQPQDYYDDPDLRAGLEAEMVRAHEQALRVRS